MEYTIKVRSSSVAIETFINGEGDFLYLDTKDQYLKLIDIMSNVRNPGEDIVFTFSAETIPHSKETA